jgi:hypothetical protein
MTLSLTCRGCGTVLGAETEDELVALSQEHAAEHGHTGPPPREHVLREFAATTLGSGSPSISSGGMRFRNAPSSGRRSLSSADSGTPRFPSSPPT